VPGWWYIRMIGFVGRSCFLERAVQESVQLAVGVESVGMDVSRLCVQEGGSLSDTRLKDFDI
jgi:hypothetical protein